MKTINRLAASATAGTFLIAASAVLYFATQSHSVASTASGDPDSSADAETDQRVGSNSARELDAQGPQRLDASEHVLSISIEAPNEGIRLSQPRLQLIDRDSGERFEVGAESALEVPATADRRFELESLNDGWTVEQNEIRVAAHAKDLAIPVSPRHSLFVQLTDARRGNPLEKGQIQVHWENADGVRNGSPIFAVRGNVGGHFLVAPPIRDGRLRVETTANLFRPYQSDWQTADAEGWFDFEAAMISTEESTATIAVRVVDPAGSSLDDAWIAVFEEVEGAPTTNMMIGDGELFPIRRGEFDPDLVARSVTARMSGGIVEFRVEAPGTYRIASWDRSSGRQLSDPIELSPRERKDLVQTLAGGIRVEGQLTLHAGAQELSNVSSLGRIVMTRDEHRFESTLNEEGLTFGFSGLEPGDYDLAVTGFAENFDGKEVEIPIHSQRVTIPDASPVSLLVELGSDHRDSAVEGRILADIDWKNWRFLIGLAKFFDEEEARTVSAMAMRPLQGTTARSDGTFTFARVPAGRYRVIAMGRREDLRGVAFFQGTLVVDGSGKVQTFELRSGRPAREFRTSDPDTKFLSQFRSNTGDRMVALALHDLPKVVFGGGESTWLHGDIPGGTMLSLPGERSIEIPEGADVVLLQ